MPLPNADFLVEVDLLPLLMAGALQLSEVLLDRHPKFTDFSAALLIMGILTAGKIEADQHSFHGHCRYHLTQPGIVVRPNGRRHILLEHSRMGQWDKMDIFGHVSKAWVLLKFEHRCEQFGRRTPCGQ